MIANTTQEFSIIEASPEEALESPELAASMPPGHTSDGVHSHLHDGQGAGRNAMPSPIAQTKSWAKGITFSIGP